jgi:hypothetical protein
MWQLPWTKYAAVNDYNRCGNICKPIRAKSLLVKVLTFLRDSNEWMFVSCHEFHLALRDFLHRRKCCKSRSPCSYQLVVNLSLIGPFPFFLFLFVQLSSFFFTLQPKSSLAPLCLYKFPESLLRPAVSDLERGINRTLFVIKELVRRSGSQFQIEMNGSSFWHEPVLFI